MITGCANVEVVGDPDKGKFGGVWGQNLSWSEFEKAWRRGIEVGSRGDFFEEFYQGGDN